MKKDRRRIIGLFIAMSCLLSATGRAAALSQGRTEKTFRVISTIIDTGFTSPLEKVDTLIQVGEDARNRFTMHRVYQPGRRGHYRGSIILLPHLIGSFRAYTLHESHDPMQSLAANLALGGYDVYGYSPRTANLPVNACSSGVVDCSIMRDWDFNVYLSEIDYIRQHVADIEERKPAIGGFSLGGMLGIAAVNANPSGYSGLLVWDAMLYSEYPAVVALNTSLCANLNGALAAGFYFDEGLPNNAKFVVSLGELPTTQVFGSPTPTLGTPTFTLVAPNETFTALKFSSFPRVFEFLMATNNVESLAILRDAECSFAGDRTFTANLHKFKAPVFAIKAGLAFGPYMQDTIDLMGSRNVRVQDNPAFGHQDAYNVADQATYINGPILNWLSADVFRNDENDQNQ
ncbi:MAG TPA: hypothetical protein VKD91_08885 [Pyrinomonadaceae bacterium]|nr:hypothetical protein [Pyrinomonadaceae bacterium]